MAVDWEDMFSRWASPPGKSEEDRIDNAVSAVRKAFLNDPGVANITRVLPQGSYRNRVNVRRESDVDLGVLYTGNTFFADYPPGMTRSDFGNLPGTKQYGAFKDEIERALVSHFGRSAVRRGNKAFDIHENSYRIDADVVPMFVHRRYRSDRSYVCGVELRADSGERIVNWPERFYDDSHWPDQHYENGVTRNAATGRRYKGVVRILKTLRNKMEEAGISAAKPIAGFFVECLVWNVDVECFGSGTWDQDIQNTLAYLWRETQEPGACAEWREVSDWKYLFKGLPDSKRQQANAFIDAAWSFVGERQ